MLVVCVGVYTCFDEVSGKVLFSLENIKMIPWDSLGHQGAPADIMGHQGRPDEARAGRQVTKLFQNCFFKAP